LKHGKFDSVLCYCHGHIRRLLHKLKGKRCVDRHADSVTHNLRLQPSLHWHGVWTYYTRVASAFALLWTFFGSRNGMGTTDTANYDVVMPLSLIFYKFMGI
jgi:hypothetical protein